MVLLMAAAFLVGAGMRGLTAPAPEAGRDAQRERMLAEVWAEEEAMVTRRTGYAWQDESRGLVRLPLARAEELALEEWRYPAAARRNLIWRADLLGAPVEARAPE